MRAIAVASVVSIALVGLYLGLGGASYEPAAVADPCATRDWRDPSGLQEVAEQIVLSGLDGAACELDVSREQMVLAFANRDSLARFAAEQGISTAQLERVVRAGLVRALEDAVRAGAIEPAIANLVRGVIERVPIDRILDVLALLPPA
jgi:hypothetical protein